MRTNIYIDETLISKAQKLSNIKTKKAVVEKALQLLIKVENQKKLSELWGKVAFDEETNN
ncbi:type II toxin-antitoxin system VapB family antitoxin [Rubrolithibacter danxiaensis]|uniref:type II toxin-antitoxin system VapB family antitoxin n=1 Tax=Rubrolithibacter danxiaensis TaxID=3390805 RepID=UPI003BF7AAE3